MGQAGREGGPPEGREDEDACGCRWHREGGEVWQGASYLTDSRAPDQHRCSPTSYLSSTRHQAVPQGTEY